MASSFSGAYHLVQTKLRGGAVTGGAVAAQGPGGLGLPYFWVSGDVGITKGLQQSGNAVTSWTDQGSGSHTLTQTDGTTCPTAVNGDTKNGLQVVNWDSANLQQMTVGGGGISGVLNGNPKTIAIVGYRSGTSGATARIQGLYSASLTQAVFYISGGNSLIVNNSNGQYGRNVFGGGTGWFILICQDDGSYNGTRTLMSNGSGITIDYTNAVSYGNPTVDLFGVTTMTCKIAEYVYYNNNSVNVSDLSSALNSKWAVY